AASSGRAHVLVHGDRVALENFTSAADFAIDLLPDGHPLDCAAAAFAAGVPVIAAPSEELMEIAADFERTPFHPAHTPAEAARVALQMVERAASDLNIRPVSVQSAQTSSYAGLYKEVSAAG